MITGINQLVWLALLLIACCCQSSTTEPRLPEVASSHDAVGLVIVDEWKFLPQLQQLCLNPEESTDKTLAVSFHLLCTSESIANCSMVTVALDGVRQNSPGSFDCGDGDWKYHSVRVATVPEWCSSSAAARQLSVHLSNGTTQCAQDSRVITPKRADHKLAHPFNQTVRSDGEILEVNSLGRSINVTASSSLEALHASFMTRPDADSPEVWVLETTLCVVGQLTASVLSMVCPPHVRAIEKAWPHVLTSFRFSAACQQHLPLPVCVGNESGVWELDQDLAVNASDYEILNTGSASTGRLPIVVRYHKLGTPDWTQLIYGQWLAWDLWADRYDQAMYGARHFVEELNLASPINNTADMFFWRPNRCRFLPLSLSAALLRELQAGRSAKRAGDLTAPSATEPTSDGGGEGEPSAARCWISRVGVAGTSRVRGLFYGLQAALRPGRVRREKLRRASYLGHDLAGVQLDYVPLHGSEYAQFFWQEGVRGMTAGTLRCEAAAREMEVWLAERGYCGAGGQAGERQILSVTLGLYEVLWGPTEELEACGWHFLQRIQRKCRNTSTVVVYKTEEACPSRRADQPEHWQVKTHAVNRIMAAIATQLSLPVLDAHAMTLARSDATQDGSHYWYFNTRSSAELEMLRAGRDRPVGQRPDPDETDRFTENAVSTAVASALLQLGMNLACPTEVERILNKSNAERTQETDADACPGALELHSPNCMDALCQGAFHNLSSAPNNVSTSRLMFHPGQHRSQPCGCAVTHWQRWARGEACRCLHGVHIALIGASTLLQTAERMAWALAAKEADSNQIDGQAGRAEPSQKRRWVGCEGATSVWWQRVRGGEEAEQAVRRAESEVLSGVVQRVLVVFGGSGSDDEGDPAVLERMVERSARDSGLWRRIGVVWRPSAPFHLNATRNVSADRLRAVGVGVLQLHQDARTPDIHSVAEAEAQVLVNFFCLRGMVLSARIRRHRQATSLKTSETGA